jgi:hypothetical protein
VWGERGKLYADRQELRAFFTDAGQLADGYDRGWNVRYTTSLTKPVEFYVRGEEYSAQLEHFRDRIEGDTTEDVNSFADAAMTDAAIQLIRQAANRSDTPIQLQSDSRDKRGVLARVLGRS